MILPVLALAALGSPTLQGSTGAVTVPTAEIAADPGVVGSFGYSLQQDWTGGGLAALPVGLAAALSPGLEWGVRMERAAWSPALDGASLTIGTHLRLQAVRARGACPALSFQVTARGVHSEAAGEALVLATTYLRTLTLSLGAGPRLAETRGLDAWTGASAAWLASRQVELLAEASLAIQGGVHSWEGRGGVRMRAHAQIWPLLWAGGGQHDGGTWIGLGLGVGLASKDPLETDLDGDGLARLADGCPTRAEDPDGWEDEDGCPDLDNDGDGIPDAEDPTPDGEPEATAPRFEGPTPRLKLIIDPD